MSSRRPQRKADILIFGVNSQSIQVTSLRMRNTRSYGLLEIRTAKVSEVLRSKGDNTSILYYVGGGSTGHPKD